jgi:alanine dehydrogenase
MESQLTIGLARIHAEPGERRDFLPDFVASLAKHGAQPVLEQGYGSGINLNEEDYRRVAPTVVFAPYEEVFKQDYVLVLRCPGEADLRRLRPAACLISMLHYPTRPNRVALLRSLQVEAISLDSIKDDTGRRLVENLRAVAWNGLEVAFQVLSKVYPPPGFASPDRAPLQVTLLGAGAVGSYVVQAAVRYGDDALRQKMIAAGVPGVRLNVVDYDLTDREPLMREILARTDILVDATQRPDPSRPVIRNDWIAYLPQHAVLLDLSVDPYDCSPETREVKGIEGVPQGNLDQFIFTPDDPAFDRIPACVQTTHRRHSVSCYSWPGLHPRQCMEVYGHQIRPLLRKIIEQGGVQNIRSKGSFFERAMARAMLSRWAA